MNRLRLLIYAAGNFGKALITGTFAIVLLFYLTDILHLNPTVAGLIIFITLLTDAVCTLITGFTTDGLKFTRHRAGRLIITGAPLTFILFATLFALPALHLYNPLLVLFLVLALRLSFILVDLPHAAMTQRIEPDARRRTRIEAAKFGFTTLGGIAMAFIIAPVLNVSGDPRTVHALIWFGFGCGLIGPAFVLMAWYAVRRYDTDMPPETTCRPARQTRLRMKALWHRDFAIIFIVIALIPFTFHLFGRTLAYQSRYIFHDISRTGDILAAAMVGQILGLFLWNRLRHHFFRLEKARTAQIALAIMTLGYLIFYLAMARPEICIPAAVLAGIGVSGIIPELWSMASDCIDLTILRSGQSSRTYGFGALTFASKISLGCSALLFSVILDASGYREEALLPPEAIRTIHIGNALLPAIISAVCLILLMGYRLSYARHRQIRDAAGK